MDLQSLNQSLDRFGCCGFVVGPQQRAALQNSLVILRKNHKFSRVHFWGKIQGVEDDYYIAQGVTNDCLGMRKTLYSKNCVHWLLLNPPNEDTLIKSGQITGRFSGDPAHVSEQIIKVLNEQGDGYVEKMVVLKEEDRLAAVIAEIDHDVRVVPRGALIRSSTGQVLPNRHFEGLSVLDSLKLSNYFHYRKAERTNERTLLDRADYDRSIDFMDCLEEDMPKGVWSIQSEKAGGYVLLKSLLWLGYNFYHVPETQLFGSVYIGTGEKNVDLPFML